eukprot:3017386-Pleurochrysis_carterae.AAC.2
MESAVTAAVTAAAGATAAAGLTAALTAASKQRPAPRRGVSSRQRRAAAQPRSSSASTQRPSCRATRS